MKRSEYNQTKADLTAQLEQARGVVERFTTDYPDGPFTDTVGQQWNDAHDEVTRLEFALRNLDQEFSRSNSRVSAETWALVDQNID